MLIQKRIAPLQLHLHQLGSVTDYSSEFLAKRILRSFRPEPNRADSTRFRRRDDNPAKAQSNPLGFGSYEGNLEESNRNSNICEESKN
jgi:hypothetical protein